MRDPLARPVTARASRLLAATPIFFSLALLAHGQSTAPYSVADLGDTYQISGFQSKVLNDQGEVIGNTPGANGGAYLYTGGSWMNLGQLNNSGGGDTGTIAYGLNNSGLVVGASDNGVSNPGYDQTDACYNNALAGIMGLGLASLTNSAQVAIAYGCNDLGVIVGNVIDYSAGTRQSFLYHSGAGLLSEKSDNLYSFAVNRFGDVLGAQVALTPQATLNGAALPPSTAGFTPHALNNSGQILLSADAAAPLAAGWGLLYNYGTQRAAALANLSPHSTGYTTFLDLNDAGDVVGRGSDASSNPHAILYTASSGLVSLDSLGLTAGSAAVHLVEADGINNANQIVCLGYTTDPTDLHGYLLTPNTAPVLPLAAAYDGVATAGGAASGAISIVISKNGGATVKLKTPKNSYAYKITLSNGAYNGPVTGGQASLQADAAHENIAGTLTVASTTYAFTALRQVKLGIFAGKYTALLQLSSAGAGLPQGVGFCEITIGKTGAVALIGELGDGTPYSAGGASHYDGSWTFYAPLYGKSQPGSIAGNVSLDRTASASDYSGVLSWMKPGAFTTNVTFQGAAFKALKDTQLLQFTNPANGAATFAFNGGGLTLPAQTLSVNDKNLVTASDQGSDQLSVKLSTTNGALKGSFVADNKLTFAGVVQQKLNVAGGVFVNQGIAGSVELTPQ